MGASSDVGAVETEEATASSRPRSVGTSTGPGRSTLLSLGPSAAAASLLSIEALRRTSCVVARTRCGRLVGQVTSAILVDLATAPRRPSAVVVGTNGAVSESDVGVLAAALATLVTPKEASPARTVVAARAPCHGMPSGDLPGAATAV